MRTGRRSPDALTTLAAISRTVPSITSDGAKWVSKKMRSPTARSDWKVRRSTRSVAAYPVHSRKVRFALTIRPEGSVDR